MINDHEAMNKDVLAIMQKKGYAIPAKLPCDLKAKYKYLNQWMGKKFDRKYAAVDVDEHKLIVALFTETSVKGTDDEVR
jgi:predicted outer membrane protein